MQCSDLTDDEGLLIKRLLGNEAWTDAEWFGEFCGNENTSDRQALVKLMDCGLIYCNFPREGFRYFGLNGPGQQAFDRWSQHRYARQAAYEAEALF